MKEKIIVLITIGAFALTAMCTFGADTKRSKTPKKLDTAGLYAKYCRSCHGKDGKGKTKMGKKMKVKDYSSPKVWAALKDDKAFANALKNVKEGMKNKKNKKKYVMKPFKKKLTDPQIKDLTNYMKKFKKEAKKAK